MNYFSSKAKWIGMGEGNFKTGQPMPALELRKCFTLDKKPAFAECLILGLGLHVLHINGRRVGDGVLSPAVTAYDKRALYLRHDITDYLTEGENVIAVKLGNGFFNESVRSGWNFHTASWRNTPRLRFELFADGESFLASDVTWRVRNNGATVHNVLRTGEYYDARLEDGWREIGYCDGAWRSAVTVHPSGGILEEMTMPEIKECEDLVPVASWQSQRGMIYDFGKNIAGYVTLECEGPRGVTLSMVHSEKLDGKELDTENAEYMPYEHPFGENRYTFAGKGIEKWTPEFVYHGFRYVELIWDSEGLPAPKKLTAHFVHTALRQKGSFTCSNELFNWIYDAGLRSFLSNYQGVSLDCPHREKNGWTGDAVISANYAVRLFDMNEAYNKWLRDMTDAQRLNGQLPGIVPTAGWGFDWGAGPAWDFAAFALPYVQYLETGDQSTLDTAYPLQRRYLSYAQQREDDEGLVCYGLSDWCPPRRLGELNIMPNRFSDSCFYAAMHTIAAKNAALHGDRELSAAYIKKARDIRAKVKAIYGTDQQIQSHGQGALAFLVCYGIVEGDEAQKVADRLAQLLKEDGYVQKVGILGMKALPHVLSRHGHNDVAIKMLSRTDYPSYGYWKSLGETTLCELWEETQSRNHHMYGDVIYWLIENIAGLKNCGIAYDRVSFTPGFFDENCSASACTETPRGQISIRWEKIGDKFTADLIVPAETDAILILGEKTYPVKTGSITITL